MGEREIVRLKDFDAKKAIQIQTATDLYEVSVADVLRWVAPNAPENEAMKFLQVCRMLGVNPLVKEAHLVQRGTAWAIIVDKSAFIRKAEENPAFSHYEAGVIAQKLIRVANSPLQYGEEEYRTGTFVPKTHVATGGWCKVFFKDGRPIFEHSVSMDEYNSGQSTWKQIPATMIRKVAIVQALNDSGACRRNSAYTPEEVKVVVDAVKSVQHSQPEPIDETPTAEEIVDVEFVDEAATHPVAEAVGSQEEAEAEKDQPADYDDSATEPNYVAMDHAALVDDFLKLAKEAGLTDDQLRATLAKREVSLIEQLDRNQLVNLCRTLRSMLERPFPDLIHTREESIAIARELAAQLFKDERGAFSMEAFGNYFVGMFEDDYHAPTLSGLNEQDLSDLIASLEELVEAKKVDPDTLVVPTFRRRVPATA